ncbi:MAG: glutamate racemase [Candidatus Omnitrophica bacterium]|nr:glutamate racemase [Candidatus Omnitrophota bacterium]
MNSFKPIGVFDSGIGGLTVVRALRERLPKEDIIYFGDTARVPYGNKSQTTIERFSLENARFLIEHQVKMIVIACNSSSAFALQSLRASFRLPILGVIEAGAKRAIQTTENRKIGVIGTHATISSRAYETVLEKLDSRVRVFSQSCPLFVPLVEEHWLYDEVTFEIAKRYLSSLRKNDIDTLILGCTHYPLLGDVISRVMGDGVRLVDSATSMAIEIEKVLREQGLETNRSRERSQARYFVSDDPDKFVELAEKFLGEKIEQLEKAYV